MKFKIYYEENIYNLDEQRGKGKIYDIISKSKPTLLKKLFSKKSYAHVPSGTYEFYIDGYCLGLSWILNAINLWFCFLNEIITKNKNLLLTINDEGPCIYIVTLPQENNMVRLVFLDRKEPKYRNWQKRYRDDELKNTIAAKDILISKYELIKQFNAEFKRIYEENKYYLSKEYEKECQEKQLGTVCQEYVLKTFEKFIPIFDKYLKTKKVQNYGR